MDTFQVIEILLVDDSAEDAELTLRTLRKGGVNNPVFTVRDGVEALAFVFGEGIYGYRRGRPPGLLLLDLKMPQMGGTAVLERLRAVPEGASIPVIVLTASAAHRDIVDSYNLGVVSYLIKPVGIEAFNDVIGQLGLSRTITSKVTA